MSVIWAMIMRDDAAVARGASSGNIQSGAHNSLASSLPWRYHWTRRAAGKREREILHVNLSVRAPMFLRIFLIANALGLYGLCLALVRDVEQFEALYKNIRSNFPALPGDYKIYGQHIMAVPVMLVFVGLNYLLFTWWRRRRLALNPNLEALYKQSIDRITRYYNSDALRAPISEAHERDVISGLLNDIRKSFHEGYKAHEELRVTMMVRGRLEANAGELLFIEFWSNHKAEVPTTHRRRKGFARGEGYCGKAWKEAIAVVGTKRRFLGLLPDGQYVETSPRQKSVRCFFSVPISATEISEDMGADPIALVINLDATDRRYFPTARHRHRRLATVIEVFARIIYVHLLRYKEALERSR
jgi:hypothetical protein